MQFRLPDVGEGITESVIRKWHVSPGQTIAEDDLFCTIETDKAVVDLPAPCTGNVLSLDVEEGTVVSVGTVIAQVVSAGETAGVTGSQTNVASARATAGPREPAPPSREAGERELISPHTRQYATDLGVDLSRVSGSGPRGRILRSDVDAAARPAPAAAGARAEEGTRSERTPMSRLRQLIAENMQRSVRTIPHATSSFRCDAAALMELREQCEKRSGRRVPYTALFMKAMIEPLKRYPYFNASVDDEKQEIISHGACHIGFATHTQEGLVVPVIKDADRKGLVELSEEIDRLAALARERRVPLADLRGGTITLSNIGSHGGHDVGGRPIIYHPQVAIIAVGRIRQEPAVRDDAVCVRPCLNLTASYDHRLIDGVYASEFMEFFIEIIEAPEMLLASP